MVAAAAAAVMRMPAAGSQSRQPCCASCRAALAGPRGRAACSGSWTSSLPGPAGLPSPLPPVPSDPSASSDRLTCCVPPKSMPLLITMYALNPDSSCPCMLTEGPNAGTGSGLGWGMTACLGDILQIHREACWCAVVQSGRACEVGRVRDCTVRCFLRPHQRLLGAAPVHHPCTAPIA